MAPYANEHSCRLHNPGKYDEFKRQNCQQKHDGKCIDAIFGIKEGKSEIQALRYKKDIWTADAARSHCKSREGSFEAASESDSMEGDVMEERGAIGSHDTGTSDAAWDAGVNEKRLKEDQDASYYKKMYAWQDPEANPKTKTAYKFPHHEVSGDGTPGAANIKGCQSGIGNLNGARGGSTIPSGDRKGVWNHLAHHLRAADVEPAELKQLRADETYECECIECGHTLETDEHCKDLKCPECGGEMRRKERPGPGRMETPPGYERRTYPVEEIRVIEDDGSPKISGYAAVFNKMSEPMMGFREKIAPGAFKKALKNSDARALFNHNPDIILGRQSAGTLKLQEDEKGLLMEVTPPDTQYVRDVVLSPIRRGDIKEQSFGFIVKTEEWKEDKGEDLVTRTIVEVDRLFDVSPVTFPAYPDTSVALRSMEAWRKEQQASDPDQGPSPEDGDDGTAADVAKAEADLDRADVMLREIEIKDL